MGWSKFEEDNRLAYTSRCGSAAPKPQSYAEYSTPYTWSRQNTQHTEPKRVPTKKAYGYYCVAR